MMEALYENYLEHHGVLGQKWGVRRYQNPDGSLTEAGRRHYGVEGERSAKQITRRLNDLDQAMAFNTRDYRDAEKALTVLNKKAVKKKAKGKELSERDKKRSLKEAEKMGNAMLYIAEGRAETDRILKSIDSSEFDVKSYKTIRDVKRGKEYVADILAGITVGLAAGAVGGPAVLITKGYNTEGTEYRVKKKTEKQKAKEEAQRKAKEQHDNINWQKYEDLYGEEAQKEVKRWANMSPEEEMAIYEDILKKRHKK